MTNGEQIELRASWTGPVLLWLVAAFAVFGACMAAGAAHGHGSLAPAIVIAGIAVAFAAWGVALAGRRLAITSDGFEATSWFGRRAIRWDELDHYTFWAMDRGNQAAAQAAGGLVGVLIYTLATRKSRAESANRRFTYGQLKVKSSRATIVIDSRYRRVAEALDDIFEQLHRRLRARSARDYLPFQLSDSSLQYANRDELRLPEIERVVVSGGRLSVRKHGKRLAWAASAMRKIHNSVLMLEDLGERGVKVVANQAMFLPAPTLETVNAAAARQAAMPAARVVQK